MKIWWEKHKLRNIFVLIKKRKKMVSIKSCGSIYSRTQRGYFEQQKIRNPI